MIPLRGASIEERSVEREDCPSLYLWEPEVTGKCGPLKSGASDLETSKHRAIDVSPRTGPHGRVRDVVCRLLLLVSKLSWR